MMSAEEKQQKPPEEMALRDAESGDPMETTTRPAAPDAADGAGGGGGGGWMDQQKKKLLFKVAGVMFMLVLLVVVVVLAVKGLGSSPSECPSDDGFSEAWYQKNGQEVYLKYKFLKKPDDELYSHPDARKACQEVGAELWEVVGGREEWEEISKFMGKGDDEWWKYGFWLGAEVLEDCPQGTPRCREEEAKEGRGLEVRWPRAEETSTYSRLLGGYNTTCVQIEGFPDRLWSKETCETALAAPCVKRGCAVPERDSPKAEHR